MKHANELGNPLDVRGFPAIPALLLMTALSGVAPCPAEDAAAEKNVAPAAGYEQIVDRLRSVVRAEVTQKDLPACSISLVDGDRTVWAEGFGFHDAKQSVPATAQTVYRVGSVSKLMTDVALMQLVEAGRIDLDAPVKQYLPSFTPQNDTDLPITLRQLTSHRSGLVRESPVGHYFDPTEPTLAATVESLNRTKLVYDPQSKTKYSNAGIAVVGAVIEELLDTPYSERIATSVLRPLAMHDSGFVLTPELEAKTATGWMWTYDGRRFEAPTFAIGTAPAGNLYSSVLDLSQFLISVLNDGAGQDGPILKPATLELMTSPQLDADGSPQRFGIGFHIEDLDGHKKIGHGGAVYGFSTQLEALPEKKLGVAAAAALDGSNGVVGRIADYALRLLLAKQAGEPLPRYRTTGPVPSERAQELIGTYQEGDRLTKIAELNGRLLMQRGSYRYELRADSDDGSIVTDDPIGFGTTVRLENSDHLVVGDSTFERVPDQPPEPLPERWKGLIGEYGWDHNTLYILEDRGRLVALIEWFYYYPLEELSENVFAFPDYGLYHGEKLHFRRDGAGRAIEVNAAEVVFVRREVGTKDGETFKITPVKPIDDLRERALAASPPPETGDYRDPDLVELTSLDPTIKLDVRYATTNNFTGAVFYRQPRAFMQRPAAEAVVRVHQRLKNRGLGLLIHDAYRPWFVTKMFWDATPADLKDFVANPANGSRHNRGCAVDLALYDLATGEPIPMVAGYDEFSPRSFPLYPGGTARQRWYRRLLRQTMEAEGFTIYEYEWWHFDYKDWKQYRIGNATFEEILAARSDDRSAAVGNPTTFEIERSVMHSGYDGKQCWVHARAGAIPPADARDQPQVVLTTQRLDISGSDVFYGLHFSTTDNRGGDWTALSKIDSFARRKIDAQTEMTVCDYTPQWHAATGTLLGTGHTVWYRDNRVMKVRPRATAYAVFDSSANAWSPWKELDMPDKPRFNNCGAGSVQRFDLPNGDVLLPVYFKSPEQKQYSVTVCRCRFDGTELTYVEHGTELTVNVQRGLVEPSLTKFGDRFYLTLRNDEHGYVATSTDGLHYDDLKRWTFDDGTVLGNYNTQQHWVTHSDGLFLVYTRKGADNDHVFRHRAPLFIAQVDPEAVHVIRETEQVLVPQRGARLGNFGVVDVSPKETWVTVTEWMQTWGPDYVLPVDNPHGADNSIHVAKLKWASPNRLVK